MSVIIKINTGYVGATHECDTGLSAEEWKNLSDKERSEWIQDEVNNHIEAFAYDEENDEELE